MNHINRLEENWTPKWDLGLQNEFDFSDADSAAEPVEVAAPRSAWELASKELFNRQTTVDRRIDTDASIGDLISFFESLYCAEGSGNE